MTRGEDVGVIQQNPTTDEWEYLSIEVQHILAAEAWLAKSASIYDARTPWDGLYLAAVLQVTTDLPLTAAILEMLCSARADVAETNWVIAARCLTIMGMTDRERLEEHGIAVRIHRHLLERLKNHYPAEQPQGLMEFLAYTYTPASIQQLFMIANSPLISIQARRTAIQALGLTQQPNLIPALAEMVSHEPVLRDAVIIALGEMADNQAIAQIIEIADRYPTDNWDLDPIWRALTKINTPEAAKALLQRSQNHDRASLLQFGMHFLRCQA